MSTSPTSRKTAHCGGGEAAAAEDVVALE